MHILLLALFWPSSHTFQHTRFQSFPFGIFTLGKLELSPAHCNTLHNDKNNGPNGHKRAHGTTVHQGYPIADGWYFSFTNTDIFGVVKTPHSYYRCIVLL